MSGERKMTQLLEEAMRAVRTLPEDQQDAIAAAIMAEIEDEAKWGASFARSHDLLAKMSEEAVAEYRAGRTLPLDPDRM